MKRPNNSLNNGVRLVVASKQRYNAGKSTSTSQPTLLRPVALFVQTGSLRIGIPRWTPLNKTLPLTKVSTEMKRVMKLQALRNTYLSIQPTILMTMIMGIGPVQQVIPIHLRSSEAWTA